MRCERQEDEKKVLQLVVFQLGEEIYGIDIAEIVEIIPMQAITHVPGTAAFVEGVINLRGRIIPIINLRKRLGLSSQDNGKATRIIVVEVRPDTIGMIVDAVKEVLHLDTSNIEPPSPVVASVDTEYIRGVGKLPDGLLVLLDLERVLAREKKDMPRK